MANIIFDFKGKVALITGSSSGIGAGTAIMFAKAGANVVITGRNAVKLSEVAKKCEEVSPDKSKPLQVLGDVDKEEDLKRLVESSITKFGKLDILVNNAGYGVPKSITDPDYMSSFKSHMQTNLNSVVYLTHLCVEYLAKTKGNIVNNSSISGIVPGRELSGYSMSKSALDMFTKCMAAELGAKGIRVNSVNPGFVRTDAMERQGLDKSQSDPIWQKMGKLYPVRRVGEPEDIGNAILYLASDQASFITGTIFLADGGHLAANVRSGMPE